MINEVQKMGDQLISREALKEKIRELIPVYSNTGNDYGMGRVSSYEFVINLIDNAPTVEPFEPDYVGAERLKARQRGYEEGYHNGMKMGKTLNPKIKQGKFNTDELCRLRSDLKTGMVVGSTLRHQYQIDRYIKALDDVIGADLRGGAENG